MGGGGLMGEGGDTLGKHQLENSSLVSRVIRCGGICSFFCRFFDAHEHRENAVPTPGSCKLTYRSVGNA